SQSVPKEIVAPPHQPLLDDRQPSQSPQLPLHVLRSGEKSPESTKRAGENSPRRLTSRRRFVASGAAALFLGAAGAWWIDRRDQTYVSKLGQIRRVKLSDGS